MPTVKEFLDYKYITFGMQLLKKNIQIFLGWILLLLQKYIYMQKLRLTFYTVFGMN